MTLRDSTIQPREDPLRFAPPAVAAHHTWGVDVGAGGATVHALIALRAMPGTAIWNGLEDPLGQAVPAQQPHRHMFQLAVPGDATAGAPCS